MASKQVGGVAEALGAVRGKIHLLCERLGCAPPRLVAVSKTMPVAKLVEAYEVGQRSFGENYVQELVEKAPQMPGDVRWHFIGHLQSNKAKAIAAIPNLYMVEGVDSAKLANMLNKHLPAERAKRLRVMVQVNTSGEASKSGVAPEDCLKLVRHVLSDCARLRLVGLMTIGKLGEVSPGCFELLRKCRDEVLEAVPAITQSGGGDDAGDDDDDDDGGHGFELSMGMSGDYELAIETGATSVRVGSSIFGARAYAASKPAAVASTVEATSAGAAAAAATATADSTADATSEAVPSSPSSPSPATDATPTTPATSRTSQS